MFSKKKELLKKIESLQIKLDQESKEKQSVLTQLKSVQEEKKKQSEEYKKESELLKKKIEVIENQQIKLEQQRNKRDKGHQTLEGFKLVAPLLNKVIGRSFILTVAEEFNYLEAQDKKILDDVLNNFSQLEKQNFHSFRDEIKPNYSFRVTYSFSSKQYTLNTPEGPKTFNELMFPNNLTTGLEINSSSKSAIYLALKNKTMQSAVLPAVIFGAPLLSYSFPIFDDKGVLIGAVSFSNDITQIVQIAKSLGDVVSSDSDEKLHNLSHLLKEELEFTEITVTEVKEESQMNQKLANEIKIMGNEIIDITEKLKVLALNTAIEATKITGTGGKGINIIAQQMRNISELTRKTIKEMFEKNNRLYLSSKKVMDHSSKVKDSSTKLKEESSVLFNTSTRITSQKDELAALVRMSIDEVAQNQEDLNNIFMLIKNQTPNK